MDARGARLRVVPGRLQRSLPPVRRGSECRIARLQSTGSRSALERAPEAQRVLEVTFYPTFPPPTTSRQSNGRPEETYLETKEARAQHAQDRACGRHSEVSEV